MSETRTIKVAGPPEIFRVNADSAPTAKQTRRRARPIGGSMQLPRTFTKLGSGNDSSSGPEETSSQATGLAPVEVKHISISPHTPASEVQVPASVATPEGRVVLGGKKPKPTRVLLTKKNHGSAPLVATAGTAAKRHRKVTLGLQHLKRRVTKARRLNKLTRQIPIEQIKKELVVAKIIKEDSKAPEAVLRQMYADAKIISTKSL
jgi:hypothetical protein